MCETATNLHIAELMKKQTYDERMEMARWFRDVAADATGDGRELDDDLFAFWIGSWAEQEIDSYEPDKPSQS